MGEDKPVAAPKTLVSISEASLFLGVSEVALRQWTDEGRVKAFITPGGHRRYAVDELKKFVSSRHKSLGIKQLVTGLEDTIPEHRELDRARLSTIPVYNKLSQEDQEHLAGAGRRVIGLVMRYVSEPARREEISGEARETGKLFGEVLARSGVSLIDSVEIFIRHREPLMKAATELMKRREPLSERVLEAIPLVAHVMDEALLSLISAHQNFSAKG